MKSKLWLIVQCILVLAAAFFLVYGIGLFRSAYQLNNPFHFIMMIFASNLIILVNGTIMIGLVYRMINVYNILKKGDKGEDDVQQSKNQ